MRWPSPIRRMAQRIASTGALEELTAQRLGLSRNGPVVTEESARRNSAVWACLRLRANLVSSMPIDHYRFVDGIRVSLPLPPVLLRPGSLFTGGEPVRADEWLYATQQDLDRAGNAFGLITQRSALGLPARIDLQPLKDVAVRVEKGVLSYRIRGTRYEQSEVWHERQYVEAGLPVGLSPLMAAALSIGEYQSAQQLALDWFGGTAIPPAHLKNSAKTLQGKEARAAKDLYRATVAAGDVFVSGSDWELKPFEAANAAVNYLESRKFGLADIARFFDVPADLIDAAVSGSSITYANLVQRNLQLLVMSLGPAVQRREKALTELSSAPRYVKLNSDALLRMDPETRARVLKLKVDARAMTPDEWRALDDEPPLTDADYTQFDRLFGARSTPPTAQGVPA